METTYCMTYRQRVYANPRFPNHKIQVLGEGETSELWPDGSKVDESHKEEDIFVEIDRTVSPFTP